MNDGVMGSIESLMAEVNIEDLWTKFFDELELTEEFNEGLSAYLSLGEDIESYNVELSDDVAASWYESYSEIKSKQEELREEIEKITTVLNNRKLEPVQISLYEKAILDREREINRLQISNTRNSVYSNRARELFSLISEREEKREEWKNRLSREFVSIKYKMLNKLQNERADLNVQRKDLRKRLLIAQEELSFKKREYDECIKNYGTTNSKTVDAYHALVDADMKCREIREEIDKFNVSILNLDVYINNYMEFLEGLDFEKFWDRFSKKNYDLSNVKGDTISDIVDTFRGSTGISEEEQDNKDAEENPIVSETVEPEEHKAEPGDNELESEPLERNLPEPVVPVIDGTASAVVDDVPSNNEALVPVSNAAVNDNPNTEALVPIADLEFSDDKGKKVIKLRDIPNIVKEKIKNFVPSLRRIFETPVTVNGELLKHNDAINVSGRQLQSVLSNSVDGASLLQVISGIADGNEYVRSDKKLLDNIKQRLNNRFASSKNQNEKHYAEMYNKIMAMSDDTARTWFNGVTIKKKLLDDIRDNCSLSEADFINLKKKLNVNYYEDIYNWLLNVATLEQARNYYNNINNKDEFINTIEDICGLSNTQINDLLNKIDPIEAEYDDLEDSVEVDSSLEYNDSQPIEINPDTKRIYYNKCNELNHIYYDLMKKNMSSVCFSSVSAMNDACMDLILFINLSDLSSSEKEALKKKVDSLGDEIINYMNNGMIDELETTSAVRGR